MVQVGKLQQIEPLFETTLEKPWLVWSELGQLDVVKLKVFGELELLPFVPENELVTTSSAGSLSNIGAIPASPEMST